jgi:L,D-transpeptidase ErfK/SrfK
MTRWRTWIAVGSILLGGCDAPAPERDLPPESETLETEGPGPAQGRRSHVVRRDVPIRAYFDYLDTLVAADSALRGHPDAEHLLVRTNPWVIERLEGTDYYRMKAQGVESLDPQAEVALSVGDTLWIPSAAQIEALRDTFAATVLDLNIPEFRLRIFEFGVERHSFFVRVGQNRTRYLEMAGREVDLRTQVGSGTIVRIEKNPDFENPVDNHRYQETRRDDGVVTGLPRIPFLEPEIDGLRYGQLIHPTTNLETLGKAYSNGCVGTSEAAAWRIYYSAPLGTRVNFRYDLNNVSAAGDTVVLPDIYGFSSPTVGPSSTRSACG